MLHVSRKKILVCPTSVNVKFNGVWTLLGQSKFEGWTLFRDVNQEKVDTVLVMVAH
jgi:hypothetical protein